MHDPRRAAVSALRAWADGHDYAETLVERQAGRQRLSGPDRALLQAIVFGVLRNRRLLDHWIGGLRKGQLDHLTRDILLENALAGTFRIVRKQQIAGTHRVLYHIQRT